MVLNHCNHGDDGGSCYAACFAALESREQEQRCIMHIMHIICTSCVLISGQHVGQQNKYKLYVILLFLGDYLVL